MFIFFHTHFLRLVTLTVQIARTLSSFFPILAKSLMQYEDIWTFGHLWHPWISGGSCN